jgi:hypothetical protein
LLNIESRSCGDMPELQLKLRLTPSLDSPRTWNPSFSSDTRHSPNRNTYMALAHNRPLRPLGMLHVGTKLGIVYGIAMLVSLILLQRTTCCQFWSSSLHLLLEE